MDDHRFDELTRALGRGQSRRGVLRALLGFGGGIVAVGSAMPADAARRPKPTPRPMSCPGQQIPVGDECVCPDGLSKCGPDCCEPGISECCDNACCYGVCYGEELCCEAPLIFCEATEECCASGQICCGALGCIEPGTVGCCFDSECGPSEYCTPNHECACVEGAVDCDGSCYLGNCCTADDCEGRPCDDHICCVPNCPEGSCGSDGCGGSCGACPSGELCDVDGVCQGCGVCGNYAHCGTSRLPGGCFIACDTNNDVVCVENILCGANYVRCTASSDCEVGQYCFDSCCGYSLCMNGCGTSGASFSAVQAAEGHGPTASGYSG